MRIGPEPMIRIERRSARRGMRRPPGRRTGARRAGPAPPRGGTARFAKSSPASPSTVPSFSETWLTYSSACTAKPWFCTVTSTRPVRASRTGWFAPRWPNGSLNVSSPSARPSSWWPRQMPKSGTRPSSPRTVSIGPCSTARSPGPLPTSTARGWSSRIASASQSPGTTATSTPVAASRRGIERLQPRSTRTTRGPGADEVRLGDADAAVERPAVDRRLGERAGMQLRDRRVTDGAAKDAVLADAPHERARVDVGDRDDALLARAMPPTRAAPCA